MRVLVADNDDIICDMVCEMLEQSGVDTGHAASCREASVLMMTSDWDVLLTDLLFEDAQTGLDLADEAKGRGIRCVIMSGALECRETVEAKGPRFLAKPFRFDDLLAAIVGQPGSGLPQLAA